MSVTNCLMFVKKIAYGYHTVHFINYMLSYYLFVDRQIARDAHTVG